MVVLLLLPPECWYYRHVPPGPDEFYLWKEKLHFRTRYLSGEMLIFRGKIHHAVEKYIFKCGLKNATALVLKLCRGIYY